MKKLIAILFCLSLASTVVQNAHADNKVTTKIKRGVTNVFTAPGEIPKTISNDMKQAEGKKAKIVGFIPSIMHGLAMTVVRAGSGLFDIVTSNLDAPKGGQPLLKPDYVWQKE